MSDFARVLEVAAASTPAPVNTDVPHVLVDGEAATSAAPGSILTCTMGNWEGTPGTYDFRWRRDGADLGISGDTYSVLSDDVGHALDCLVTASNIGGSASIPSGAVSIPPSGRSKP